MPSSEFWRNLADQFLTVPSGDMLRADGHYIVGSGVPWEWRITGSPSDFVQNTFESFARRGAFEIAPAGTPDLFIWWLEALRQERCGFRLAELFIENNTDGTPGKHHQTGSIDRLCESSVKLCRIFEARALQAEFDEKQRNDPKNWSPLRRQVEAFRGIKELISGPRLNIPEALVRETLARQYGIKPEEVTFQQIRFEISGLFPDYPAITLVPSESAPPEREERTEPTPSNDEEIERRKKILDEYKTITGASNKKIYEAKNSGIHKPQFYEWIRGTLPANSTTAHNFERFLKEKKLPIPRKAKG
jgi:hypothetical protein